MKNLFLTIAAVLSANLGFSQWVTTGTATTNALWTGGNVGIGYTTSPTFGTNRFMVTGGNAYFSSKLGIGTSSPTENFQLASGNGKFDTGRMIFGTVADYSDATANWGIKSDKPFIIASSTGPDIQLRSTAAGAFGFADLAIATVVGGYSQFSAKGDVVLRGYTGGSMIFNSEGGSNIKFVTCADPTNATTVYNTTKVQMTVTKTGNVGIGTETPDTKLAVNGTVHAKEVVVDLVGWPDYVFEEDYALMPLSDLEKSIADNGHLPNIPSAQEIEINGVQLGEMNKKLMEKVEELTLYVIQLNKELQEVKAQQKNK